jgi:hypothetical protein
VSLSAAIYGCSRVPSSPAPARSPPPSVPPRPLPRLVPFPSPLSQSQPCLAACPSQQNERGQPSGRPLSFSVRRDFVAPSFYHRQQQS